MARQQFFTKDQKNAADGHEAGKNPDGSGRNGRGALVEQDEGDSSYNDPGVCDGKVIRPTGGGKIER